MNKSRKWQFSLIITVIALTIYNILPTLFYYSKPLTSPIQEKEAMECAKEIYERVDSLEKEALDWLKAYCTHVHLSPSSILVDPSSSDLISVRFLKTEDATRLRELLPRAGHLIPFFPASLHLGSQSDDPKEVLVQRKIGLKLSKINKLFESIQKREAGNLTQSYRNFIYDRAQFISKNLQKFYLPSYSSDLISSAATQILEIEKLSEKHAELAKRLANRFATAFDIQQLKTAFSSQRDQYKKEKKETTDPTLIPNLESNELKIAKAEAFLKKRSDLFQKNSQTIEQLSQDRINLANQNPLFEEIWIDWKKDRFVMKLYSDVQAILLSALATDKQIVEQYLIDEIAKLSNQANEEVTETTDGYAISFHQLADCSSFLSFKLDLLAKNLTHKIQTDLQNRWHREHSDLKELKIVTADEYENLPFQEKNLCLVIHSPMIHDPFHPSFQNHSIYVIAKGVEKIIQSYQENPNSKESLAFIKDFKNLSDLLRNQGFIGYPGNYAQEMVHDFVFEQKNYYEPILLASREDFRVIGSGKSAILEFSDHEQRIIALNKIDTAIHNDLMKWDDDYATNQVSLNSRLKNEIPKPTQNVFWSNLKLHLKKLFRGDERKILRWGLDLSGGKSVQIELRDQNNQLVENESDIKQGINELYSRVNKMGVSDVSIRQVGNQIALEFPGLQTFSAADLIKASSMHFHIVNEKFSSNHPVIGEHVDRFLTECWNEAIVTNRKSAENIQKIAHRRLHLDPPTDTTKILLDNGLKIASPSDPIHSHKVDESISKIGVLRNFEKSRNPLMILFQNPVLDGSNLENIRSNYDPSKGNSLNFEVKHSSIGRDGISYSPQSNLFEWTSTFSKESVIGTSKETYTPGSGWRMAVVLNDTIISAPTLESALRDGGMISGSFSAREIQTLVSDLKAGSLTFTPRILTEKNISPDLGKEERVKGISATIIAFFFVVGTMVGYYRFGGFVSSIAILFNLLIIWAILQNLGASLSLAGIAGIILTVGMAVDANVLVFERVREEFSHSGKIASAIREGYEKAFSAILDSNVTTIIAALILMNFDAGPIKAFAITMIIGIASSMFTALYMTRFYFNGWLQNPKNTALSMANWIRSTSIEFLKWTNVAFAISIATIVIGSIFLFSNLKTIFGMDFTGGYSCTVELADESISNHPILDLEKAFIHSGLSSHDFQIRQISANQFQIFLSAKLEEKGKPFHLLQNQESRIEWTVNVLQENHLLLDKASLSNLGMNWSSMSGQMSETMRYAAISGLLMACFCIFVYITIRFEYKYAIAALLCLFHDVLITLALFAILYALNVSIQIDLNTIAAIMTIIGYSLNDTIIVFDRIREDVRLYKTKPMTWVINHALNATLSRTCMTSGTTFLVLLALLLWGGSSIFGFALVMAIGVVAGTVSSWFIAAPLLLIFHRKEQTETQSIQSM